jgi:hypothetical protein
MKKFTKHIIIHSALDTVFAYFDDISNTGMHMTKSSMPMMGGKLELIQLSPHGTGLHSKFQWKGRVVWMGMDFTVVVTQWKKNELKVWETIGVAKMIILSWYRMHLMLRNVPDGTRADLNIIYKTPENFFGKILAFFLAGWYANWCLKKMLNDAKKILEHNTSTM